METIATRRMPNWLMKWSTMSSTCRPLVVDRKATLSTAIGTVTAKVAVRRVSSNLSRTAEITTSATEISEVSPAMTSEVKNSTPMTGPRPEPR